jgi:major membrane immunogen (membrane-anchored lipoprotein)
MKKLCIFLLLIVSILGGCSGKYIVFSGESKNWEGTYSTTINGRNEDGSYTFHYKNGDSNTKLQEIEIIINNSAGETIQREEEHIGASFNISSSCQGCAVTRENERIKVTIKWDGKYEENFFLDQK